MKAILVAILLLCASSAWAQQTVSACVPTTNSSSGAVNCVPVSSTNPLPIYLPLGH